MTFLTSLFKPNESGQYFLVTDPFNLRDGGSTVAGAPAPQCQSDENIMKLILH